jgi:6-methylsalicylate decarboxylase
MIMKHLGVQSAILSVAAPGPCILSDPTEQAALARRLNEYAAGVVGANHAAFGFFASLPDPRVNTSAALAELAHALDVLGADGVVLPTRYGDAYLGHADLEPVWRALSDREATVFVHPTHPPAAAAGQPAYAHPAADYAHETTRAALDMITARTLRKFPGVKVILSHAGGTLPFVIGRVAEPLRKTPGMVASWMAGTTHNEAMQAFRSFYYDVALSTTPRTLRLLMDAVPMDHILFGVSDAP